MSDLESLLELINAGGYPPTGTNWRELTHNYNLSKIQDLFCEISEHEKRQYVAAQIRYSYTRDTKIDRHSLLAKNWYLEDENGLRTYAPQPSKMSEYILSGMDYADQLYKVYHEATDPCQPIKLDKKVQAAVLIALLKQLGISRNSNTPKSVPMIKICNFIAMLTNHSISSLRNDMKGLGICLNDYHDQQIDYVNSLLRELNLDIRIEKNQLY